VQYCRGRAALDPIEPDPSLGGADVPSYATHYHLGSRRPLQSLSDLDDDEALVVMEGLNQLREDGLAHRRFGLPYLLMRRETEVRLRNAFVEIGGRPRRLSPHYFVIGDCPWFERLAVDMRAIRIALADLDPDQVTLTYGDSFEAMRVSQEWGFGGGIDLRSYHSRVYRLEDLDWLLGEFGAPDSSPDEDYGGYERRSGERWVELQLWSDEPVVSWLAV
jgi:hypothetical protein